VLAKFLPPSWRPQPAGCCIAAIPQACSTQRWLQTWQKHAAHKLGSERPRGGRERSLSAARLCASTAVCPYPACCTHAPAGDIVAVELLPEAEWRGPSSKLPVHGQAATRGKGAEEEEGDGDDEEDLGSQAAPEVFQVRA